MIAFKKRSQIGRHSSSVLPVGASIAMPINFSRSCVAARATIGPTLAALCDPPETGAFGNFVSPSSNRTRFTGMPSASAAICVITV